MRSAVAAVFGASGLVEFLVAFWRAGQTLSKPAALQYSWLDPEHFESAVTVEPQHIISGRSEKCQ